MKNLFKNRKTDTGGAAAGGLGGGLGGGFGGMMGKGLSGGGAKPPAEGDAAAATPAPAGGLGGGLFGGGLPKAATENKE